MNISGENQHNDVDDDVDSDNDDDVEEQWGRHERKIRTKIEETSKLGRIMKIKRKRGGVICKEKKESEVIIKKKWK
jgi:hypothetical protein